jgi:hypothetical protein
MGEFHDAVSHLLDAFARGVSIIKTQRRRRKSIPIDPASMSAESLLSKTLKHNQVIVGDAYGKDFDRHGLAFAKGDGKMTPIFRKNRQEYHGFNPASNALLLL